MGRRRRWGARVLAVLAIAAAVAGLAVIFTAEPLPPTRVEIERSLDAVIAGGPREAAGCWRDEPAWRCRTGRATYRVSVDRERCWRATRVGRRGKAFPRDLDGCVDDTEATSTPSAYD